MKPLLALLLTLIVPLSQIALARSVLPPTIPSAPSALAVAVTGLRADLTWADNSGDETYFIIERKVGAGAWAVIKYLVANTIRHFDYTVWPSTTYDYRVKACNVDGCSSASNEDDGVISTAPSITGNLSIPANTLVDEVFIVDARAATNFCRRPQADGSPSLRITIDGDDLVSYLPAFGYAARSAGVKTFRLNGKNCSGSAATEVTATTTVAEIATATGDDIHDLTDVGNATTNASNLQAAINAAAADNDTAVQEIRFNGCWTTTIKGPINMTVPEGNNYITAKWTGLAVARDNRILPAVDMTCAPTITQDNTGSIENDPNGFTQAALQTPTTATDPPSHHYRWQGIHLKKAVAGLFSPYLVVLGMDSAQQTTPGKIVHHFIFNHIWLEGHLGANDYAKDGIRSYGDYVSFFDGYASEFKRPVGADSSAGSISGGRGPTYWYNSYWVAGDENFSANTTNFSNSATISSPTINGVTLSNVTNLAVDEHIAVPVGGAYGAVYSAIVASISGNDVTFKEPLRVAPDNAGTAIWQPTNRFLTFRRNHCFKPLTWNPNDITYGGVNYSVKNLWETKNNVYLILDSNVFQNSWNDDQSQSIVFGSATPDPGPAGHALREVQFTNNLMLDNSKGPSIIGSNNEEVGPQYEGFFFINNLFRAGLNWQPAGTAFMVFTMGSGIAAAGAPFGNPPQRVFFIHNTGDHGVPDNTNSSITSFGGSNCTAITGDGALDSMWYSNLDQDRGYGYFSQCGFSDQRIPISVFMPPGDSSSWNNTQIVNANGHQYPASAVAQTAAWDSAVFENYANGDMRLKAGNPGKGTALDGTDIGVNTATLKTRLGCTTLNFNASGITTCSVVTGSWTGQAAPVCAWHTSPVCQ